MGGKSSPPPPDYGPLAAASERAAELGYQLGQEQLGFSREQYEALAPYAQQYLEQQSASSAALTGQAQDYYDYMRTYRPLEQQMLYQAMGLSPESSADMSQKYYQYQQALQSSNEWLASQDAEVKALARKLQLTPQESYKETTTTGGGQPTGKGMLPSELGAMQPVADLASKGKKGDTPPDLQTITETLRQTNPEYAKVLESLSEREKELLVGKASEYANQQRQLLQYQEEMAQAGLTGAQRRAQDLTDYERRLQDYTGTMTADPQQLYAQNRALVEAQVGQALADTQGGFSRTLGQIGRQGLRYGLSPQAIASQAGQVGLQQASVQASMANQARQQSLDEIRGRAQTGYGLTQSTRQALEAQRSLDWARQLDIAGLGRGLVGASQGAYGAAGSAGMQGLQGGMAPGQQYMAGMGQGAGTIMAGQQQQLGGLSNILSAQTSVYNTAQSQPDLFGSIVGTGLGVWAGSDIRLKEDIEWVGRDERTGIPLYEFNYIGDPEHRYRGVMADDVELTIPEAVMVADDGYKRVNYGMIGIKMVEVSNG